jgi:hypothetical protein
VLARIRSVKWSGKGRDWAIVRVGCFETIGVYLLDVFDLSNNKQSEGLECLSWKYATGREKERNGTRDKACDKGRLAGYEATERLLYRAWANRLTPQRLRLSPIPSQAEKERGDLHGAYGLDGIRSELLLLQGRTGDANLPVCRVRMPGDDRWRPRRASRTNDWRCSDRGERRPLRPILLLAGPRSPARSIACLSRTRTTACMHAIEICDTTSIAATKRFVCLHMRCFVMRRVLCLSLAGIDGGNNECKHVVS